MFIHFNMNKIDEPQKDGKKVKKLLILAGMHGNETAPSLYFSSLPYKKFETLNGWSISIVPNINPYGTREHPIYGDINRGWGNNDYGDLDKLVLDADLIIDWHEALRPYWLGGLGKTIFTNSPLYMNKIVHPIIEELKDDGWKSLYSLPTIVGTLDWYCDQLGGKPYILIEVMGQHAFGMESRIKFVKNLHEKIMQYLIY